MEAPDELKQRYGNKYAPEFPYLSQASGVAPALASNPLPLALAP